VSASRPCDLDVSLKHREGLRDMLKQLKQDGWKLDRTRGDHRQYTHPVKPGTVTVPVTKVMTSPGTLNSILRQAGLKR